MGSALTNMLSEPVLIETKVITLNHLGGGPVIKA